MKHKIN